MEQAKKEGMAQSINLLLVVLLIIASFLIGSLWTNVQYLKKTGDKVNSNQAVGTRPTVIETKTFDDVLKKYAQETGLELNKFQACVNAGSKKSIVEKDFNQGQTLGVLGTPAFFINGKFLGGAFPYEAFKEIIDKELEGNFSTNYKDYSDYLQKAYENPSGKSFDPAPKNVEVGDSVAKGSASVKVTIVEFSDFQCPYCAKASPTLQKILEDYTGKVRLVYKHFPLSFHSRAQKTSEASECARDQGKFWEFHDKLFDKQAEWANL